MTPIRNVAVGRMRFAKRPEKTSWSLQQRRGESERGAVEQKHNDTAGEKEKTKPEQKEHQAHPLPACLNGDLQDSCSKDRLLFVFATPLLGARGSSAARVTLRHC